MPLPQWLLDEHSEAWYALLNNAYNNYYFRMLTSGAPPLSALANGCTNGTCFRHDSAP